MSARTSIMRNVLSSWATHVATLAIGFFLMPYVLKVLGDSSYGTWIFINSVASYATLMYFGFGSTIGRYVAEYHARHEWDRLNQVVNVVFAYYAGMGLLALTASVVLAIVAPSLYDWQGMTPFEVRTIILLLGLNFACGISGSAFSGVLMGIQRFDLERGIVLGTEMLRLVLTLLFLSHDGGLITLAGIYLAVTLVENAIHITLAFVHVPTLQLRFRHVKMAAFKECCSFGLFTFLGTIANQLMYASGSIIIGAYLGATAIVPYYIALRLCQFIRRPIQQIGEVCMPRAGQLNANADTLAIERLIVKGMGLALLLSTAIFIGAAFFGDWLIANWMGSGYSDSHAMLLVLLGAQVVALPFNVLREILVGMGRARGPAVIYLTEAIANVVLSLLLVKPYGTWGVALAMAIPVITAELTLMLPYACRQLGFGPRRMAMAIAAPQLLPLMALAAYSMALRMHWNGPTGWGVLMGITLGGSVVLAATWGAQNFGQRYLARLSGPVVTG